MIFGGGLIFLLFVTALTTVTIFTEVKRTDNCEYCQIRITRPPIPISERCMTYNPNNRDANGIVLRNLLQNFINADTENRSQSHVNIVLIGHGSYSTPEVTHTGHSNLREVVLYQPYGTEINDAVVFGISTGNIRPEQRRFDRPYNPPRNWNRVPSNRGIEVPSVWLDPLEWNHDGFRRVENCLYTARQSGNRILIAYIGEGPSLPLWSLATDIAEVASQLGVQITVHWAACLTDDTLELDRYVGLIDGVCVNQYALYRGVMRLNNDIGLMANVDIDDVRFWAAIRPFFSGNRGARRPIRDELI